MEVKCISYLANRSVLAALHDIDAHIEGKLWSRATTAPALWCQVGYCCDTPNPCVCGYVRGKNMRRSVHDLYRPAPMFLSPTSIPCSYKTASSPRRRRRDTSPSDHPCLSSTVSPFVTFALIHIPSSRSPNRGRLGPYLAVTLFVESSSRSCLLPLCLALTDTTSCVISLQMLTEDYT